MNDITRNNFEAILVDYWDGKLSPAREAILMRFLEENPDLRKEAEGAGGITIHPDELSFRFKDELLKPEISRETIDEFLVSELEGQLLPHQQNELNLFVVSNPQFQHDRKLYALTRLSPDHALVYPDKKALRRGNAIPLWVRYGSVAAAACILLGIGTFWLDRQQVAPNFTHTSGLAEFPVLDETPILTAGAKEEVKKDPLSVKLFPVREAVIAVAEQEPDVELVPVRKRYYNENSMVTPVVHASENFYSYAKNRKPDDYLQGLVNSYVRNTVQMIPHEEPQAVVKEIPDNSPDPQPARKRLNAFASRKLKQLVNDDDYIASMAQKDVTLKAKLAKTFAFATGRVSKGKLIVESINNEDGSLAALSFSTRKYNYTKKF